MRRLLSTLCAIATAAAASLTVTPAEASNYLVYIAGRTQAQWDGATYGLSGYTTVKVAYNSTTARLAEANATVRQSLASYCSGGNQCIIVCYSNGCHQTAYTQANYPEALTGLLYVQGGGAAWGGSEIADSWVISGAGSVLGMYYDPGVDTDLKVTPARSAYNHYLSAGRMTYHVAGDTNLYNTFGVGILSGFIDGDDDGVVAFHSAFGCVSTGSQTNGCSKFTNHTNRCNYDTGYCSGGVCGGGWFSAGTDHMGIDDKAAWCF